MDKETTPATSLIVCQQEGCGWTVPRPDGGEEFRILVEALTCLHVLLKHPQVFAEATGRSAEEAAHAYAWYLQQEPVRELVTCDDATTLMLEMGIVEHAG